MAAEPSDVSSEDPIYPQAVRVVIDGRSTSVSFLQHQLKIGYNRAARLLESMEVQGLIGAPKADGSRDILHDQSEPQAAQAAAVQRPTTPIVTSVGGKLLAALLQEVRNLDKPWINTPENEQQRVIDRLRAEVDRLTRQTVNAVAQCGFPCAIGLLEQLTVKDGVKATLSVARGTDESRALMDAVGTHVLFVFADHSAFVEGMERIKADVDQPELPLEPAPDLTNDEEYPQ